MTEESGSTTHAISSTVPEQTCITVVPLCGISTLLEKQSYYWYKEPLSKS